MKTKVRKKVLRYNKTDCVDIINALEDKSENINIIDTKFIQIFETISKVNK